jgi:hypothetical protein
VAEKIDSDRYHIATQLLKKNMESDIGDVTLGCSSIKIFHTSSNELQRRNISRQ